MYQPCLPPDDLPSLDPSYRDLSWELEEVAGELFYRSCDPITQDLLSRCGWDLTTAGKGLTLVIICPNSHLNWQIVQSIPLLAESLQDLSPWATIRIYPPTGMGSAMEVVV